MWDEYDWERFLQQQDGKTEKYMQLLETYLDDPRRDEIIAREMGWTQLLDAKAEGKDVALLIKVLKEARLLRSDNFLLRACRLLNIASSPAHHNNSDYN